ncbi:MAG: hypothetical protein OEV77_02895 [Nitrospira sp.]|nr:hypothetical protein [Nitrospira sp.]
MLYDIGLTRMGGSTVFGDFDSAVSERAGAGIPYAPGRRESARAAGVDYPPLGKSPNYDQISIVSIQSEALCMDSRFIRRQP